MGDVYPVSFQSHFGNESAVRMLRRALEENALAGAYLLSGAPGCGKTHLAVAFARAAACLNPQSAPVDGCGECESCRRADAGQQPEIVRIAPAGDQTQVWQFWDREGKPPGALHHSLAFAPVIGKRRVYIIERADTLNAAAANSLLKVLEEPPPYALFVLLTPHPARLLPTVLSRCQLVRLSAAPTDALAGWLCETAGLPAERARTVAALAEGRTGAALSLARSRGIDSELSRVMDLAETIPVAGPLQALKLAESIRRTASGIKALAGAEASSDSGDSPDEDSVSVPKERAGRRQLGIVIDLLIAAYRDLLTLRLGGAEARIVNSDRREALCSLAARRQPQAWMSSLEALLAARRRIDQNANPKLVTDLLAIQLAAE